MYEVEACSRERAKGMRARICLYKKRSTGDVRRSAIAAGTKPGHTAFEVTPVPVSRRYSSYVNHMFASFEFR